MSDKVSPFAAIFAADDPHGLLSSKAIAAPRSTEDEITVANFEAINSFIDKNGFMPGSNDGREPTLSEFTLEAHLETFRAESEYHTLLAPFDRHGLLSIEPSADNLPTTMAELIASGNPLLKGNADEIFTLRHVSKPAAKAAADDIATRRPCENFADYATIFASISGGLANGDRKTKRFERETSIQPGTAFILNGVTAYVSSVSDLHRRGKETDGRLRVIFENGTESNHLLRSFARVLYDDENGRQIVDAEPVITGPLFTGKPEQAHPDDRQTGSIYIVESLSQEPAIAELRGRLYKVGFTTRSVESRVVNAEADPTFLLAPVRIVTVFDTVNLNPGKLENLIHQFFSHARLQVDVLLGRKVSPQEWFVVPIELVREAISRILDGTIVNVRYDHISRKIVAR